MEYLADVSEVNGLSRVYTHLSAISHHHKRIGKPSPCDDTQMKMFMKGLKRHDSLKTPKRAKPLTPVILTQLISLLENDSSLVTWRTVWRCVVSFSLFLRWDDVRRLKVFEKTFLNVLCAF